MKKRTILLITVLILLSFTLVAYNKYNFLFETISQSIKWNTHNVYNGELHEYVKVIGSGVGIVKMKKLECNPFELNMDVKFEAHNGNITFILQDGSLCNVHKDTIFAPLQRYHSYSPDNIFMKQKVDTKLNRFLLTNNEQCILLINENYLYPNEVNLDISYRYTCSDVNNNKSELYISNNILSKITDLFRNIYNNIIRWIYATRDYMISLIVSIINNIISITKYSYQFLINLIGISSELIPFILKLIISICSILIVILMFSPFIIMIGVGIEIIYRLSQLLNGTRYRKNNEPYYILKLYRLR